jgi:hypothetical protein
MKILVDTRDQLPFSFTRFKGLETERATLAAGRISLSFFFVRNH